MGYSSVPWVERCCSLSQWRKRVATSNRLILLQCDILNILSSSRYILPGATGRTTGSRPLQFPSQRIKCAYVHIGIR